MRRPQPHCHPLCALILAVVAAACGDHQGDLASAPSRLDLQQFVTGDAAIGLDENGRFRLTGPVPGAGELPANQAVTLATAFITTSGPSFRRTLQRDRGGPVDLEHLQACGQAIYAASAFEPLPPEVPGAYHRHYGSWWLVGFCGRSGRIEVSVAVSALATELRIADGRIDYGRSDGNEFFAMGVPPEWDGPVGLSPERAVMRLGRLAQRRVERVPTLVAADPGIAYPQGAVWRIVLEAPVRAHAKRSGRVVETPTLFAGLHEDVGVFAREIGSDARILRVPAPTQPDERQLRYWHFPSKSKPSPSDRPVSETARLQRRADTPVALEAAAITGED